MMISATYTRLYCLSALLLLVGVWGSALCQESETQSGPSPVWRFWSPVHERYFYTIGESERDKLIADYSDVWEYEEIAFRAFAQGSEPNLAPVYRFWSSPLGDHLYTLDEDRKDVLVADANSLWTYEGVAFYVHRPGQEPAGTVAVHRYSSDGQAGGFYTARQIEMFELADLYCDIWQDDGIAWYAYAADVSSDVTIIKGPYLQDVTPDSVTVMWETDISADSCLEYDLGGPAPETVVDSHHVTLHKMRLTGLEPDTFGAYRVTSGNASSELGAFATAPVVNRSFRCVVYGDTRSYADVHAAVVQSIIDSGPEIVFHTGDLINLGRDYRSWGLEFFGPAEPLLRNTPLIPVAGNHEYYGSGPAWFFYFFDRPPDEGWFAVTYGNVRFVGLNTDTAFDPNSAQHDWLLNELTSPEYRAATWHVVLFHHPAFTQTVRYCDNVAVKTYLVPLFQAHGVDIAFSGHSHTYERYFHHGIHYIVTGGGSGPLYPLIEDTEPPFRQFGLTVNHHCTVDIDAAARTLTLRAVDTSGAVFDTIQLKKGP